MNIIITGASSGIGYELFKILRKKKENNFFLLSRNTKKINKNKKVKIYKIDLKNKKKLTNIVKKIIVHSNKKIDLIICNAAEATFGPVDKIPIEHYEKNFDVNFFSHLILIKSILPLMKRENKGHIVNISSGAGIFGFQNSSSYSIGKSSMQILIESLYHECKAKNIHTKNIFPGLTNTNFYQRNIYLMKRKKDKLLMNKNIVAKKIASNLFKKKLNIFCQNKTKISYLIKIMPNLEILKNKFS
jgi:hypothetical protein|tara:strand:- start:386 stop:1117 length:732 start_codon:yes stop_codon:yes gene_type:complete